VSNISFKCKLCSDSQNTFLETKKKKQGLYFLRFKTEDDSNKNNDKLLGDFGKTYQIKTHGFQQETEIHADDRSI
jgi:hypothetical protein